MNVDEEWPVDLRSDCYRRAIPGSSADVVESETALTVLVVDDEPDMRMLARAVLEHAGIVVTAEARDGTEALTVLRELDPPPVPTVVVLDNQMPGPSGIEVAARIRAELPAPLIVLFSAFLNHDIIASAERLGVTCVSKDEALRLGDIIRQVVAERSS